MIGRILVTFGVPHSRIAICIPTKFPLFQDRVPVRPGWFYLLHSQRHGQVDVVPSPPQREVRPRGEGGGPEVPRGDLQVTDDTTLPGQGPRQAQIPNI